MGQVGVQQMSSELTTPITVTIPDIMARVNEIKNDVDTLKARSQGTDFFSMRSELRTVRGTNTNITAGVESPILIIQGRGILTELSTILQTSSSYMSIVIDGIPHDLYAPIGSGQTVADAPVGFGSLMSGSSNGATGLLQTNPFMVFKTSLMIKLHLLPTAEGTLNPYNQIVRIGLLMG